MSRSMLTWSMLAVVVFSTLSPVLAYEGSSAGGASLNPCGKVGFSEFAPQQYSEEKNNTEVAPESEFSFLASQETFPDSILVTVGDETVPIAVTPHYAGYHVTGHLPSDVTGTFVRISIAAQGPYQCERGDGWLLKVAATEAVERERAD
ncbi:MAG: hypothetical protein OEV01_08925 [Nitrospira sp.]|nr:hypothetical protein [Nitrospira sp.]MDH4304173.1 hypothetical protein [Nitrospira sp.]MDH5192498.1 hypothetical protein [Nitrospira sp.]